MKCFVLTRDFGCQTSSHVTWALEPGGETFNPDDARDGERRWWHPYDDVAFEVGGNTWAATGPMIADTKEKISRLWAQVRGGKRPFVNSHVLGDFTQRVTVEVVVDTAFVETMMRLNPGLFDFTPHDKVWDHTRNCIPWDGAFFFATVLPLVASYDLDASSIVPSSNPREKFKGAYGSSGGKRAVRASTIAGRLLWRDAYTRDVLCTDEFLKVLKTLGVREWHGREVDVIADGH